MVWRTKVEDFFWIVKRNFTKKINWSQFFLKICCSLVQKNFDSELDHDSISLECIYHQALPYMSNVPACRFTCRRHGRQGSKIISNKSLIATRKLIMLRHNSQISLMNTDFKIYISENLVHFDLQTHCSLRRRRLVEDAAPLTISLSLHHAISRDNKRI